MATECFPPQTTTFWLRRDFVEEFCFLERLQTVPTEAEVRPHLDPGVSLAAVMAHLRAEAAGNTLHWCHAYFGAIATGQTTARPFIWDGLTALRVPEEGLFQSMLDRMTDARGEPRGTHPIIYPKTLLKPAREVVKTDWVVLHDSRRSLAGVVTLAEAHRHLRRECPF